MQSEKELAMQRIEAQAKKEKRRWLLIMVAAMAAVLAVSGVAVSLGGLEVAPYALIFAIVGVTIAAKLCMAQVGKVLERQRNEREKAEAGSDVSRFNLRG